VKQNCPRRFLTWRTGASGPHSGLPGGKAVMQMDNASEQNKNIAENIGSVTARMVSSLLHSMNT
jgi:hypothetical protein